MDRVEVGGLGVAYERAGQGPPLVLLHGYVGDGPSTWRRQLDALSADFTVIAWDAPGAGRSDDPPETFGTAGYADCLAGFLTALGVERAHVAGLSFGGTLALALAERHPGRVRSLVLLSAYAGWGGSLAPEEVARRLDQALELSRLPPERVLAQLLPSMFRPGTAADDVAPFATALAAFHPSGLRALARASAEDLRGGLPDVTVPTLVVHGTEDERAPGPVAEELHRSIAGSQLLHLDGVGHLCTVEAPVAVNEAMRTFLRRVDRTRQQHGPPEP